MGFFNRIFGAGKNDQLPEDPSSGEVQSVRIVFTGVDTDRLESFVELELAIAAAVLRADAGEHDGHALVDGQYMVTLLGSNADAIFDAIAPAIESVPLPKGSYAIKCFGDHDDPASKRERVDITWDG